MEYCSKFAPHFTVNQSIFIELTGPRAKVRVKNATHNAIPLEGVAKSEKRGPVEQMIGMII
jgi:hypothetical protein